MPALSHSRSWVITPTAPMRRAHGPGHLARHRRVAGRRATSTPAGPHRRRALAAAAGRPRRFVVVEHVDEGRYAPRATDQADRLAAAPSDVGSAWPSGPGERRPREDGRATEVAERRRCHGDLELDRGRPASAGLELGRRPAMAPTSAERLGGEVAAPGAPRRRRPRRAPRLRERVSSSRSTGTATLPIRSMEARKSRRSRGSTVARSSSPRHDLLVGERAQGQHRGPAHGEDPVVEHRRARRRDGRPRRARRGGSRPRAATDRRAARGVTRRPGRPSPSARSTSRRRVRARSPRAWGRGRTRRSSTAARSAGPSERSADRGLLDLVVLTGRQGQDVAATRAPAGESRTSFGAVLAHPRDDEQHHHGDAGDGEEDGRDVARRRATVIESAPATPATREASSRGLNGLVM